MRRPLVFACAWVAVAVAAVAGTWAGLQPVLTAGSADLPTDLSAAQLRDTAPVTSASPATADPSAKGLSPPVTPEATGASPTAAPVESPTPPAPSPGPPLPEPPASSDWERQERPKTFERTFVLRGGEVVVSASPGRVEVISHTANPGYEHSITRWSRSSVIITFESADETTSRLWVMWRNGPYAEVTETI